MTISCNYLVSISCNYPFYYLVQRGARGRGEELQATIQNTVPIERLREGFETARANRLDLRVTLLVYRENERKRGRP